MTPSRSKIVRGYSGPDTNLYQLLRLAAFPHKRALEGMGSSSLGSGTSESPWLTLMYSSWPRYLFSTSCDLRFHMPSLSKYTNTAVHDVGYTCTVDRYM